MIICSNSSLLALIIMCRTLSSGGSLNAKGPLQKDLLTFGYVKFCSEKTIFQMYGYGVKNQIEIDNDI